MKRRTGNKIRGGLVILTVIAAFFCINRSKPALVYAAETDEAREETETSDSMSKEELEEVQSQVEEGILDEIDMKEINEVLSGIFPEEKITFQKVLTALLSEDETISPKLLTGYVTDTLFYVVKANKSVILYLLLIIIAASVFSNFSSVFQNRQVAQVGFYIVYILLITSCLHTFQQTVGTVKESLENLNIFMRVLGPAYFMSMAIATGSASSIAFYSLVLFLIYLVELLILNIVMPLIHVYLMVKVLNFLSDEEYLSKLAELLETVIGWSLKTMLACVTGISLVQGVLTPAMDTVKRSAFTKGAQMIPGIGDALGGVTEVILGTAVLIKNGIGMAGALIAAGICLIPILNMGILTLMYKGLAALIQPISDKRIVEAVSSVGEGYQMLLRVVFTTGVLFMITIGISAAATS